MKLKVVAHPNSRQPRVEEKGGYLHVYVREPAKEDKANAAVAEAVANYFKTNRRRARLLHGAKSKTKIFEIDD